MPDRLPSEKSTITIYVASLFDSGFGSTIVNAVPNAEPTSTRLTQFTGVIVPPRTR